MSDYSLVLEGKIYFVDYLFHFGGKSIFGWLYFNILEGKCIFYTFLAIYIGYVGKYLFISFLN